MTAGKLILQLRNYLETKELRIILRVEGCEQAVIQEWPSASTKKGFETVSPHLLKAIVTSPLTLITFLNIDRIITENNFFLGEMMIYSMFTTSLRLCSVSTSITRMWQLLQSNAIKKELSILLFQLALNQRDNLAWEEQCGYKMYFLLYFLTFPLKPSTDQGGVNLLEVDRLSLHSHHSRILCSHLTFQFPRPNLSHSGGLFVHSKPTRLSKFHKWQSSGSQNLSTKYSLINGCPVEMLYIW